MDVGALELGLETRVADAGIHVAYLVVAGLNNRADDDAFTSVYQSLQASIVRDESLAGVRADPRIAGYRNLHDAFGVTDTTMTSSPESIFKALFEHRVLPPINLLVDIYNYVSLKFRISAGAHDLDKVSASIELATTRGDERFLPLGRSKPQPIPVGEYAYKDADGEVVCRLECRQSDKTKIQLSTRNALFILQGHPATSATTMSAALEELKDLLSKHCGPYGDERLVLLPGGGAP